MKKYLLTLVLTILCVFVFAISASAQTYTVSSDDEYKTAYESAVSGDTIIVDSKLTCDIYANKSITYVLKADWESSKLVVNQANVEVSFIADGGDYRIMPTDYDTTDGWLNLTTVYENVVINLGGMNGGTLTIDGSNATHDRVTYVTAAYITLNLLSGSAIANFNTTENDSSQQACIIYAKTVNMYEGSKIYGNRVSGAPLIKAIDFNLYGGEIFGNLLTSTRIELSGVGFIFAYTQFTMYGGRIYDNIFNATNGPSGTNVVGFISVSYGYLKGKMVVYDGELGDNYVSGNGSYEVSAMFGINNSSNAESHFYYNTAVKGTRYKFTDTPTLELDSETGKTLWKVKNYTLLSEDWNGWCWKQTKVSGDKVAIFLNAQKKTIAGNNFNQHTVINAYIDGVYVHSGSNKTIAIPSGYDKWSTDGNKFCHTGRAYTLDEVKAAQVITLYSAYDAERVTIDGITMCAGCKTRYTCNDPTHDLEVVSISYTNFSENGVKVLKCNTCGLEKATEVIAAPIFTCLGYSTNDDNSGIATGFSVNHDNLSEYERISGKKITFGVVVFNPKYLNSDTVFTADGKINASKGALQVELDLAYAHCKLCVSGMSLDNEEHTSLELVFAGYAYEGEDKANIQVFQKEYLGTQEAPVDSPMASKVTRGNNVLYTIKLQTVLTPIQITTGKEDLLEF